MTTNFVKRVLAIFILSIFALSIAAQEKQYILNEERSQVTVLVDTKEIKATTDQLRVQKKGRPLIEAKVYRLKMAMDTIGTWLEQHNGEDIWKLKIQVPDAKAFFIFFDEFDLPVDGKLYAYNDNNIENALLFEHSDNPDGGPYSIEGLYGDNVVLEYISGKDSDEKPKLLFSGLGYKYIEDQTSIPEEAGADKYGKSDPCMININCEQGEPWQAQKKGVVQLRTHRMNTQTNLCTGVIVNNTSEDRKPYLLTAHHCFENVDITDPNNIHVLFEYEVSGCEAKPKEKPVYKYHRGGEIKVINPIYGGSDGVLVLLSGTIPDTWNVYFNGWNRSNNPATMTNGASIHHPNGDVKKISLYNEMVSSGTWQHGAENAHWNVKYSQGATQGGSSGSPLYDRDGLIIGTLTGGNNDCNTPDGKDSYGKLWYHWDQSANPDSHMKKYLDPLNTGKTSLPGLYNNEDLEKELIISKTELNILANTTATIDIINGNGEYKITSSDDDVASATVENNKITVHAKNRGYVTIKIKDRIFKNRDLRVSVHDNIDILKQGNSIKASVYSEDDVITQVRVIDLDADVLFEKNDINEKDYFLDMSGFRKGFYIIQIRTKTGIKHSKKIVW